MTEAALGVYATESADILNTPKHYPNRSLDC
jgi:hypothetical protein